MNTENGNKKEWVSKTLSTKYSSHEQGQHYGIFLQTMPGKKVLIGRLYQGENGQQIIKDPRGVQIGKPFTSREAAEQYMEAHGKELAQKELGLNQKASPEQPKQPEQKQITPEKKTQPARTPKNAANELQTIRDQKGDNAKSITR